MKKAFTLIELLVVIAIIAILAAILFPVFAQAKLAAKKTVAISNQKQQGLSLLMYANDYDDMYPRQDGCTLNDSFVTSFNVQPAGTNPAPWCNGSSNPGQYAFRDNHYEWGKWVQPYVKNTQLFIDPVIQPAPSGLSEGEVDGGYALNLAVTGALDTWPTPQSYGIRNSFLGGQTTAVPAPADAMLIMEQNTYSLVGGYEAGTTSNNITLTYYPAAFKEHWMGYFYQPGGSGPCKEQDGVIDPITCPFNTVPLSYCDGHTKAIAPGQFLANTPTAAQYGLKFNHYLCPVSATYYGNGNPTITTGTWPMWGL